MKRSISSFIVVSILYTVVAQTPVFAADSECKTLYGGGATKETSCKPTSAPQNTKATPTPGKSKPSPTPAKANTTKGGLPVLSPAPTKTTPSTGPEVLGIIALAPAMALGYYLRKRS